MPTPQDILGHLPADRVLDVATGSGGFIHFLLEGLKGYTEIIGVDNNERAQAAFEEAFKDKPNIRFRVMDAHHLNFDSDSFGLVCISNSLHHFDDPQAVLSQMERVLRPGGYLLVSEMYRDGQTETQMTHVHLHHWWAAVDTVNGVTHYETYRRDELVGLVSALGLKEVAQYDLSDLSEDPKNPEISAELNPVFEQYIQRAEGHPNLQARGEALRQRVAEIGFHSATTLVVIGRK
ncbi:demethylmenaquinone methyltransferase / 2-methoxy-6-polyprenyl-1,4-benzoquinol methylase [Anaerolineales bacterium]|nr:demethylmenaquinone methyltransferase / 2-methoxy-6-polyprenyl-1,4-benzoquinol methylase [Anaerolineales bacterium]